MKYYSTCYCGAIKINAYFPHSIEAYQARACDCDFCAPRGLAYLSDANGTISFSPQDQMSQLKQGSGQATFWQCNHCKQIVAVTNSENGEARGAVSKALFDNEFSLKPSIWVSPKHLAPKEKAERWSTVWSAVVCSNG